MRKLWCCYASILLLTSCGRLTDIPISAPTEIYTSNNDDFPNAASSAESAMVILSNYINTGGADVLVPISDDGLTCVYKNSHIMVQYDSFYDDEYGKYYLFHEYEIIVDDPDKGDSHTATYNWYRVDEKTSRITAMFFMDNTMNPDF